MTMPTIVGADGQPIRRQTQSVFPVASMAMLAALDSEMRQFGIALVCVKCGGTIQGDNRPESDTFRLTCPCAVRICHRTTGHAKVVTQ